MPARSKAQQRLFGWIHAVQKGEAKNAPKKIKSLAKRVDPESVRHFAETEHKGLPNRKEASGAADAADLKFFEGKNLRGKALARLLELASELDDAEDSYNTQYGVKLDRPGADIIRKWLKTTHGYTADVGGKTVGFVNARNSGEYGNTTSIGNLVVAKNHRGRGIGKALLKQMILDDIKNRKKTILRVNNNNPAGLRLYRSLGFNPIAQVMLRG